MNQLIDFRYAPPGSWTAICRPDDPCKTLVREDGALLYGFRLDHFESWSFDRVVELGIAGDHPPLEIEQRTESARRPIVTTRMRYARATLHLTTFAHADGDRRYDVVLWRIAADAAAEGLLTSLRVELHSRVGRFAPSAPGPAHRIYAREPDDFPFWVDDRLDGDAASTDAELVLASFPQRLLACHPTGFRPASAFSTPPAVLDAGEELAGAVVLPLGHAAVDGVDLAWAERALEAERSHWDSVELAALAIEVPDPAVSDLLTASARNMLQARELVDGLPIPHVGSAVYRGLWVVDGHFMLECSRYLGHEEAAHAGVEALLRRVRPDGSIAEMLDPPHLKETAIAIATLVRQAELVGDDALLRRVWPQVRAAVAHVEALRAEAQQLDPAVGSHGLLPPAFGDGGLAGSRGEYTTALWTLVGLGHAVRAATGLGEQADAERFRAAYEGLLADFRSHAERDMQREGSGAPYLPMAMPGEGDHNWFPGIEGSPPWHRIRPQTATWALCHAVWPGELFEPDDPIVAGLLELLERIDDEQGLPAETGWLPYRAVWPYAGSFAAHAWLWAERPDKAVEYLYALANHAAPTRVWREEQSLTSSRHGQICGDMPHNWASAEFIRLVRHLLVFERGETLELLPALPAEWLRAGRVRVERTPTRFGRVSLAVQAADGTVEVEARLEPHPGRALPRCVLHVPAPDTPMTLNGAPCAGGEIDTRLLTGG